MAFVIALLLLLACWTAPSAQADITEIAPTASVTNPMPTGLSDGGVVAGTADAGAFRWSGGSFTSLSGLGGGAGGGAAFAINAGGEVVGDSMAPGGQLTPAVYWPAGSTTPIQLPCLDSGGQCGSGAVAFGINSAGAIVGGDATPNGTVPVQWSGGTVSQIGTGNGVADDVNASGAVVWTEFVNSAPDVLHVISGGIDQMLGCLQSTDFDGGVQINASGTVVGFAPGPPKLPAYWSAGTCTTLPVLPSPYNLAGTAEGVNDAGVMVGRSGTPGNGRAVEWSPDGTTVTDLNTLLPPNSGWTLDNALAVNAGGQILGTGTGPDGNEDYFVLDASNLTLAVHSALVSEPSNGSVNASVAVTLSSASSSTVTVDYATQDGTATAAHGDYTTTTGTLSFAPGQTTQTISVPVNASGLTSDAGFGVVLSNPSGATISVAQATVEITSQPVISGAVKDRTGHPIPGVTVQIAGSSGASTATTSATGGYSVQVADGDYTVTAGPGDGRYIAQSGPDCTVSGASCMVHVTSPGGHVADFDAALGVDSIAFEQRGVSSGALGAVPDSGTYDGNTVQVEATISNAGTTALTTGVSFGRAASVAATGTTPLVDARGASSPTVTVPAGGTAVADFQWDTQGGAWTDSSQPDTDHIVRVTTDLTPGYGQKAIAVRPKPVILVHGLNATYTTWSEYPAFLTSVNPEWEAYAVGDGQAPGVMNTTPVHTPGSGVGNTILGNAGQEAEYIQGVRERTGAWHVDIVAHSMGGLISRQYIASVMPGATPDGRPVVSHLVMLGTPNEGSPCADMLSLAENAFVAAPTLQLSTTYMRVFNSQVTSRNEVPFSILAGNIGVPTCGGPNGDSVVPEFSALWTIADRTVVPGLLHTEMTASRFAFDAWIVPHLAIGPDGVSAPTTLEPAARTDVRARFSELRPARPGRNAKRTKPKPGKESPCVTVNGGLASVTGTGRFTATPAGVTRRFAVVSARSLVLAVFAPDSAITVVDPAGKAVERTSAATVRADGSLFDTFTTRHPAPGSWKLEVRSVSGRQPAAYVLREPGAATTLTARLRITRQTLTHVAATLRTHGRAQPGAHVSALLALPSGKRRTISLRAVKRHAGEYAANVKIALAKGPLPLQAVVHSTKGHQALAALVNAASACTTG